ncbi:hypothetical protein LEP1GSC038_0810 [Leptospira weilii str. 2006001855]|uniref:Uncharacterized protein n=1 Tax=Leptospira weilii str. 2006001855 TaxID=996804 RepID=M6G790_9LEPT|nr:hypothetical protein LEP1GSC038_0810 [Leptospira weilii str. 2006001855]
MNSHIAERNNYMQDLEYDFSKDKRYFIFLMITKIEIKLCSQTFL